MSHVKLIIKFVYMFVNHLHTEPESCVTVLQPLSVLTPVFSFFLLLLMCLVCVQRNYIDHLCPLFKTPSL